MGEDIIIGELKGCLYSASYKRYNIYISHELKSNKYFIEIFYDNKFKFLVDITSFIKEFIADIKKEV